MDARIRKGLLNSRSQLQRTRIDKAMKYAKEHNIKLTKKQVKEYIKEIDGVDEQRITSSERKKLSKKFVFNYLGCFFADIGFNRNAEMGKRIDGDDWLKYFVVVIHGNSGWAKVYEIESKSRAQVMTVLQSFRREMKDKYNYPVRKIVTDDDKAFDDGVEKNGIPITRIKAELHEQSAEDNGEEIQHTNHRVFARIDSFMSQLRRYAWNQYKEGIKIQDPTKRPKICNQPENKEFYIPLETINAFVQEYNNYMIPHIRCTRNEMIADPNLEKAYICWVLYGNEMREAYRAEKLANGTKVKLAADNKPFGNKQEKAHNMKAGVYTIVQNQAGHYVGYNEKDDTYTHFPGSNVKSVIKEGKYEQEAAALADVEDPFAGETYDNPVVKFNDERHNDFKGVDMFNENRRKANEKIRKQRKQEEQEALQKEREAYDKAVKFNMDEMEAGLPPDLSPEKLASLAALVYKRLKESENEDLFDVAVNEAKGRRLPARAKDKYRKSLIEQVKSKGPMLQQVIQTDKMNDLEKLVSERRLRISKSR